jgi:hypothetical protein
MLRDFQDQIVLPIVDRGIRDGERVQNRWELSRVELDVDDRTDDLRDFPDVAQTIRCHDDPPAQPSSAIALIL